MKYDRPHLISLVASLMLILPVAAFAQEITFTYNPPDSTKSHVYSTNEETEIFMMEEQVTRRIDHYKESYFKTDSNFIVSGTLLSTETYVDDEKQEETQLTSLIGLPITSIIDLDGRLDSLDGYDVWQDSITYGSQADFAKDMPHYYDYEPFFIRIASDWKSQIGDFAGKTFAVGDTIRLIDTVNNIEGTSFIRKKVWFAEMTDYDGAKCVVIEYEHSIDQDYSEMFSDAIEKSFSDPDYPFPEPQFEILSDHKSVMGRQIMDPATMLIYYTYEEGTETMQVRVYGGIEIALQIRTIEEDKTEFEFKGD